jgi:trimethylamine--corrinoid protein Co-methyltransferase
MSNILAGSHLVHDLGYLESGLTGSFTQLVICNELISWLRASLEDLEVSDETLALDVIDQIGPDGNFLNTDHTIQNFRSRWYPELFDRHNYSTWKKKGGYSLTQRAAERVDQILAEHRPEPLPEEIQTQLQKILQQAAEKYGYSPR